MLILPQVLLALAHLHDHGLVHCNVTLGNVLIDDTGTTALLSAFDVTKDAAQRTLTMMAGRESRYALPPEVRAGQPATPAADLWSFGHLLAAAYISQAAGNPVSVLASSKVPQVRYRYVNGCAICWDRSSSSTQV